MTLRTIALVLLVSAALPAFAQQSSETDKEVEMLRQYCKPDIERLCANVEPGGGRLKECLKAHQNEMTVGCAKALKNLKKK